jgi:hypothetical protein
MTLFEENPIIGLTFLSGQTPTTSGSSREIKNDRKKIEPIIGT